MREREDLIQALMKQLFTANFFIPIDFSGQLVKKKSKLFIRGLASLFEDWIAEVGLKTSVAP